MSLTIPVDELVEIVNCCVAGLGKTFISFEPATIVELETGGKAVVSCDTYKLGKPSCIPVPGDSEMAL